ncbi:sensor histidine kinase [Streptomyces radicis]|uniref:histidine kinase n=1 Tax=Streptomyces radicis TaxID=1750517 RepID=A0A3A9WPP9_9ACTN|nr:HAMP domain-containing sensor histidine kinase [Streptomyces radicis]RKN09736.1 sensor histidine kinase [Streptomyces radicis]RKN23373.1 sensor histidine kinase [Streptomyces radicis]
MNGTRRRLAGLPLRSRLALLTALAVALAVAVCAGAAWFLVRGQLRSSLDDALRETRADPAAVEAVLAQRSASDFQDCGAPPERPGAVPELVDYTIQVVDARGERCVLAGPVALDVADADAAVAQGRLPEALHDATASDGTTYRVITRPLDTRLGGNGTAVTVARPLGEVNEPLRSLAFVLALVAAAGAVGAAGIGVALARAGLRPVDRLTDAAEHIARTEDLSVRIPVTGDDEIARLSRSFNAMTEALASSRELQQQLIADAGHELRTPLTSLRTNVELLVRSEETGRPLPDDDRRRLLASVKAQLIELGALIGDLQELSRPEAVGGGARREVVALHEIAGRAVGRARLRAGGLPIDAELEPWFVRAEPAPLERAVVNLLDNAVKFGAGDPRGVRVALAGGTLSIRDHGPGIPQDELPHVFERFWRAPSARALPGSGLGLSIVARTVRENGGAVALRPAPGGGTEALLTLPGAQGPPPPLPDAPKGAPKGAPKDAPEDRP